MKAWFLLAKVRSDYKPIVVNGRDVDADADKRPGQWLYVMGWCQRGEVVSEMANANRSLKKYAAPEYESYRGDYTAYKAVGVEDNDSALDMINAEIEKLNNLVED